MQALYYHGPVAEWGDELERRLGSDVQRCYPTDPREGDLVFLAARGGGEGDSVLPGRNAFAACCALKASPRVRVFLITEAGDRHSREVARFCLADGCVEVDDDGQLRDLSVVEMVLRAPTGRVPLDAALADLEREMSSDTARAASAVQRILAGEPGDSLLTRLTDPATGLFNGPFASYKLEEEFKRSQRFHQPLSLVLLDIGVGEDAAGPAWNMALAEIAGVLLNECRDLDILARFTDTTFLLLLPGTGGAGATALCQRLLGGLGEREFGGGLRLVPRAGLVTAPAPGIAHRSEFLTRAEACLRLAIDGHGVDGLRASGDP